MAHGAYSHRAQLTGGPFPTLHVMAPQYAWFEPVLVASIIVFVIDLIGTQ